MFIPPLDSVVPLPISGSHLSLIFHFSLLITVEVLNVTLGGIKVLKIISKIANLNHLCLSPENIPRSIHQEPLATSSQNPLSFPPLPLFENDPFR